MDWGCWGVQLWGRQGRTIMGRRGGWWGRGWGRGWGGGGGGAGPAVGWGAGGGGGEGDEGEGRHVGGVRAFEFEHAGAVAEELHLPLGEALGKGGVVSDAIEEL